MTTNEGMRKYRLPNPTTAEDLEMRFSGMDGKILNFGNRVLMAGYFWNGKGQPSYYAAIYEHLDSDLSCEGTIGLRAVSDLIFTDDGHAVAWALAQIWYIAEPEPLYQITHWADNWRQPEEPEPQGAQGKSCTVVM